MSKKRCCVPQCVGIEGSYKTLHVFPKPEKDIDRFRTWVHAIGGELLSMSNADIYKLRRVCNAHFEEKYHCRYNRLSNIAVPTLLIPGLNPKAPPEVCNDVKPIIDSPPTSHESLTGLNPKAPPEVCNDVKPIIDSPPTSLESLTDLSDYKTSTQESTTTKNILDSLSTADNLITGLSDSKTPTQVSEPGSFVKAPSASNKFLIEYPDMDFEVPPKKITISKTYSNLPTPIVTFETPAFNNNIIKKNIINKRLIEHNYFGQDTDTTKPTGLKCHTPVPPRIMNQLITARKTVKKLQSEISRLRKRNAIIKTRLVNAKKNNKHNCLQKVTQNMTADAKIFTHLQYTQTVKKNSGRRFTPEELELSLSIFNTSVACYELLSRKFTLPSIKTLKRGAKKNGVPAVTVAQPEFYQSRADPLMTAVQSILYEGNTNPVTIVQPEFYEGNRHLVTIDQPENYEGSGHPVVTVYHPDINHTYRT